MAVQLLFTWSVSARICSKYIGVFLRSSHLAFSSCVLLESMRCTHTVVLIQQQLGRNYSEKILVGNETFILPQMLKECYQSLQLVSELFVTHSIIIDNARIPQIFKEVSYALFCK